MYIIDVFDFVYGSNHKFDFQLLVDNLSVWFLLNNFDENEKFAIEETLNCNIYN